MSREIRLRVVGDISCAAFHRAVALAQSVSEQLHTLKVEDLAPAEYERRREQVTRMLGGQMWAHTGGVIAYAEPSTYIGDDAALLAWLRRERVPCDPPTLSWVSACATWEAVAAAAWRNWLARSGLVHVYLDLQSGGKPLGRLVLQLFSDRLPKTAANFAALCTGTGGVNTDGTKLHYAGSPIHRIVRDGWMQGGDIVDGTGAGGISSVGRPLPDESFAVGHYAAGVVGMANTGPNSATSQFYITTAPLPAFDRKFVAFGRVIDGLKLLETISRLPTVNERPVSPLIVSGCGILQPTEVDEYDVDGAAAKLQAVRRGHAARRQRQRQQEAASRVQAITRGHASRRSLRAQA